MTYIYIYITYNLYITLSVYEWNWKKIKMPWAPFKLPQRWTRENHLRKQIWANGPQGAVGYITICDVGILYLEAGSCPRNFVFQSNFLPTHLGRQQITAQVLGPLPTTEESPMEFLSHFWFLLPFGKSVNKNSLSLYLPLPCFLLLNDFKKKTR